MPVESASLPAEGPTKIDATQKVAAVVLREDSPSGRTDPFNAGLTGIRALAALMVLAHHVFYLAGPRLLSFDIGDRQITWHLADHMQLDGCEHLLRAFRVFVGHSILQAH